MAQPTILGLGNPLLDISAEFADLAVADKYGLKMGNAILAGPEHQPLYEELVKDYADKVQYIAGGATQNSIRVAQWVSGQAPGYAAFVGSVGDDEFGSKLKTAAEADGVSALYEVQPKGTKPTGTCAVIIHEKERSLCANLVAAEALTAGHLDKEAVAAAVKSAKIFYTAGFPLTHDGGAESCLRLAKHAAENGKTYALNLSAPFIVQVPFFAGRLSAVLAYADLVFGNETEAAAWGAANGLGDNASVEAVAEAIAALPKAAGASGRTVIITQGAKSTVVCEGGNTVSVPVDPIPADMIVDVNGAGDAFVGGFIAAKAAGKTTLEAVKVGNWAAGHVITNSGCVFDRALKCPLM